MGSRFIFFLVGTFLGTVVILIGAGYAITQIAVRQPRDPFRTGAFEFDLAPGWWCEREGTEYVCSPPGQPPHAAIAVIAMKERNEQDNLQSYEAHLSQPQKATSGHSAAGDLSEVRYVKRRVLGSTEWVEALHFGSELSKYDTYYLSTTTSNLGILVTMSVLREKEDLYVRQLSQMMSTLNVYQR